MSEQVQMFSRDGKLYTRMSIASINRDNTKSEKEKLKLIELFNNANITPDDILDEDEILAYDENQRKSKTRNILIGACIVIGACLVGYLAYKGIKNINNAASEVSQVIPETQLPAIANNQSVSGTTHLVSNVKNTISMKEVSDGKFLFYDGEEYIGRALMGGKLSNTAIPGELPKSWYIPGGVIDETNKLPTYPILHIDEIVIKDQKGLFEQYQKRANGKKYGTMCMQRILEYAEQNGYGSRISLDAEKWGSNIHPGKFYAKIGFEPGPKGIECANEINRRYYRGLEEVKKFPNMPEAARRECLERHFCEQIAGRYVADGFFVKSRLYLTHPEVLKNYPL